MDTEQIIPITDAEEYLIKVANKKQEEVKTKEQNQTRYNIRVDFWTSLLQEMNRSSTMFQNVSPSKDNWLGTGSGYSGIAYTFTITGSYARVELWINRGSQDENKTIFDKLFASKEKIEGKFNAELDWQRLDDGKGSRIAYSLTNVSVFNEDNWTEMINFLTAHMIKLENSIKDALEYVMKG
ncbi:DUF4268 domain-containing protein [Pseudogracilibacillus sp. SO30301A]|uniref:DUF4268 domain-containing protein n=1 Tax=Pseudogracilibacillus sp. SO30301A TaxID=3098291 RepID=UPI00300DD774